MTADGIHANDDLIDDDLLDDEESEGGWKAVVLKLIVFAIVLGLSVWVLLAIFRYLQVLSYGGG
jgi:hypothetical protein